MTDISPCRMRQSTKSNITLTLTTLCALALSVESYLNLNGLSLCKTEACEVAGSYLKISESLLVALGAAFFWIVGVLLFFAKKYPKSLNPFIVLTFVIALCFDGVIIGFQFFTIQQRCILCIFVAVALILICSLYCFSQKAFLLLACCLFGWGSAFSANYIIKMPTPRDSYASMPFYIQAATKEPSTNNSLQLTLIFSMECPHCMDVISYLKKFPSIDMYSWRLASIDQNEQSLAKISQFIHNVKKYKNPFILLDKLKKQVTTNTTTIDDSLKKSGEKSNTFLANANINTIPVLFVEGNSSKEFFTGSKSIIDFLKNLPLPPSTL